MSPYQEIWGFGYGVLKEVLRLVLSLHKMHLLLLALETGFWGFGRRGLVAAYVGTTKVSRGRNLLGTGLGLVSCPGA